MPLRTLEYHMKPEDWQAYQAGRNPGQPPLGGGGYGPPPGYPPSSAAPPQTRRGMNWPLAILLFGLALIGGCCYSFGTFLDKAVAPLETAMSEPGVGVLVMEDEIVGSIWATGIIERFKDNPNIRSVVVRVNSPGGAVAPSQEIYTAIKSLNKPVVVSMGSVAASGGLYVAAAGDLIMANPGTITGSIGVIMQSVEFEGTMEKIGVKSLTIKSGDFKDMGSPFRSMRPDERELLQAMVMDVYNQFIADLVESQKGRGKRGLAEEDIRKMADGRIFTGSEALKLGLIDELGGFEEAVLRAAKLGGLPSGKRPKLVIEDGRKPWWEVIMRSQVNVGVNVNLPPALTPGLSLKYLYQPDLSSGGTREES